MGRQKGISGEKKLRWGNRQGHEKIERKLRILTNIMNLN